MSLKRYELYGSHVGVLEQESESGPWVSAADAQAEIDSLKSENAKQSLHLAGAIMLLKQARNGIHVNTEIFAKISWFLEQEVNAV